jgi:hypothetical protein
MISGRQKTSANHEDKIRIAEAEAGMGHFKGLESTVSPSYFRKNEVAGESSGWFDFVGRCSIGGLTPL